MIRPRQFTTRLAVAPLEDRTVPAGNVTAQMVDPNNFGELSMLSIVGDNEDNAIRVIEVAPGHVRIEGLGSTTVNGTHAVELFSSGDVITFAEIRLGNGNDSLVHEFTGNQFRHSTQVDTGLGNDSVSVMVRGVVGGLIVDTGHGDDSVTIDLASDALLNRGLRLNTGSGDDRLFVRGDTTDFPSFPFPELFGNSIIEMEKGNDVVQFEGGFGVSSIAGLVLSLGEGDDTLIGDPEFSLFSQVAYNGGPGIDTVLNASYFGPKGDLFGFEIIN